MTKGKSDNVRILPDRQPRRPNYIREWAERRGLRQTDIVEAMSVEKGLVSKWFNGSTPSLKHQGPLAGVLGLEDPSSLFRHPDEDWMWRFLRGRPANEVEQIKSLLEAGFPRHAKSG